MQLKSRLGIARKYENKDIYMAFPFRESWYLIEHDVLVELIGKHTNWLDSLSWIDGGGYSSLNPKAQLVSALESYRL